MDFFKYIHAVGTGPKGNRDLTLEESKDMMDQILNQSIPSEQSAAFLLGWRLKPETTTEFRGAIEACDAYIEKTTIANSLELGYPFDGKAKNPYIFPLVGKVLEESGLNLVLIGDELTPAKNGITIKDICTKIELNKNTHYFDRADFFPKMSDLTELRMKLGLRSGFNTIEKLPRVANSEYAITGVFHKPYVKKYVEIFSDRYKRFALIQGNEGTPELFSKGRLWISNGGDVDEIIVDPANYGINYTKSWDAITLEDSLNQLNNPSDEYMKLAKLNAAVYLFVTENAASIDEAWEKLN
ncbi:glycosyl transferase, family 3 [Sulfurimonas gotlandica GD1]|uniref:Glycosyl transferase, family 3 n=1 Tax=Sulfurimonas gotlandica (strain DSM 19862 / JCM 16533 / GD1) TaxID=929558 RepID=B6BHF8_SULGG|nr:glycosyl transferase [Sulfurimonas gotlandica]EDZ63393.1 glycosyl transferase, family 3 [Sulfurimonas gotlandica GD1]EHP29954.1 glycosyl transferase, family 3 [Sulfurimonas gotlandica GD1]